MTHRTLSAPLVATLLAHTAVAQSQYADPPDGPWVAPPPPYQEQPDQDGYDDYYSEAPYPPSSSARLFIGPALHVSERQPDAGLLAALDVGRRAAGFRATAAWVSAGGETGMSQYTGGLWLDLGYGRRLHPIVGAGGGVAVLRLPDATGDGTHNETVGVGVLAGSLQYQLPIQDTDARIAVDLLGNLPAVHSEEASDLGPWGLVVATVGVGF